MGTRMCWVLTQGGAPQEGTTPLGIAALRGHDALARVLLEVGADVHAKDEVRGVRCFGCNRLDRMVKSVLNTLC